MVKSFFDAVADASREWTLTHMTILTANIKETFRFGNRLVLKNPKVQTYHKVLSGNSGGRYFTATLNRKMVINN